MTAEMGSTNKRMRGVSRFGNKKVMFVVRFAAYVALFLIFTTPTHAKLQLVGKGDRTALDPSGFAPKMKQSYEIMKVRCVKCHTLERTVVAITSGIAPISGLPFDRRATKAYGIKMLRKPDSNMSMPEVKAVVELLNYLIEEAAR